VSEVKGRGVGGKQSVEKKRKSRRVVGGCGSDTKVEKSGMTNNCNLVVTWVEHTSAQEQEKADGR